MIDLNLRLPVFPEDLPPPPRMSMDEYSAWVHHHWRSMSDAERERHVRQEDHWPRVPFRLSPAAR